MGSPVQAGGDHGEREDRRQRRLAAERPAGSAQQQREHGQRKREHWNESYHEVPGGHEIGQVPGPQQVGQDGERHERARAGPAFRQQRPQYPARESGNGDGHRNQDCRRPIVGEIQGVLHQRPAGNGPGHERGQQNCRGAHRGKAGAQPLARDSRPGRERGNTARPHVACGAAGRQETHAGNQDESRRDRVAHREKDKPASAVEVGHILRLENVEYCRDDGNGRTYEEIPAAAKDKDRNDGRRGQGG